MATDLLVEKIFAVRTDKATGEQMLHVKWKDRCARRARARGVCTPPA